MNLVLSTVLAVAAILSTFMLQLGDEGGNAALIDAFALFTILGAIYFVDYKKTFSLSKKIANVLLVVVVLAQFGTLIRSRQEFLAFSIANILVYVQSILFYQKKNSRTYYQILTITFVQVAVGCVFQRNELFAAMLPLYSIAAFCVFSLLFLIGEREYYSRNATLSPQFVGFRRRKTERTDAKRTPPTTTSAPNVRFATSVQAPRFSNDVGAKTAPLRFEFEYFRRFVAGSLLAAAFAAFFFCIFPRIHHLEICGIEFGRENWDAGRVQLRMTTGFSSKIELGELGPSADNRQPALSISFFDVFVPNRPLVVSPRSLVYLRGIPMARYSDRTWEQVETKKMCYSVDQLRTAIEQHSSIDPSTILSAVPEFAQFETPQTTSSRSSQDKKGPSLAPKNGSSDRNPERQMPSSFFKTPLFSPKLMRVFAMDEVAKLATFDEIATILPPENVLLPEYTFDSRTRLLGMEIKLEALNTQVLFAVWPFYSVGAPTEYYFNGANNVALRPGELVEKKTTYWLATNAFLAGRQALLTPNQELVWPYLYQYLELDESRFPKLAALARRWDAESNLPQDDFVGRAQYLESKLRDGGEFQYDRDGVRRTSGVDPLEDFASINKRGHCEYFAGALALMLRAVGIPSRTVVGFAFFPSEDGDATVVRQSDAHAWTEAFIPEKNLPGPDSPAASLFGGAVPNGLPAPTANWPQDGAWLRLDATPDANRADDAPIIDNYLAWSNFFHSIWNDYVLNFNGAKQTQSVYQPALDFAKRTWNGLRQLGKGLNPLKTFGAKIKEIVERLRSGDWSPNVVSSLFFLLARVAIALYIVFRLVAFCRARRRKRAGSAIVRRRIRNEKAFAFYYRVEKSLARRLVVERQPNETPREFVERCFTLEDARKNAATPSTNAVSNAKKASQTANFESTSDANRRLFREIVERYYRARFGGDAPTPEETARWNAALGKAGVV